jgi:hypothetical protein
MRCSQHFNVTALLLEASSPRLQALGLVLILCMLLIGLAFFMSRFRDYAAKDRRDSSFDDSNFEEMLLQGDITEQEYRKIMSKQSRSLAKRDSRHASW